MKSTGSYPIESLESFSYQMLLQFLMTHMFNDVYYSKILQYNIAAIIVMRLLQLLQCTILNIAQPYIQIIITLWSLLDDTKVL